MTITAESKTDNQTQSDQSVSTATTGYCNLLISNHCKMLRVQEMLHACQK